MSSSRPAEVSRRAVLSAALGLTAGAGLTACTGAHPEAAAQPAAAVTPAEIEPFHGPHQAGIVTPAQAYQFFAAFDVLGAGAGTLRGLLDDWTPAAAALAAGRPPAGLADSGEAAGASPARTTITIGYGPSLFDGRFGLASRRPPALAELPRFDTDNLRPELCGGDLAVQVCADDAQVAFHAYRQLLRIARERVRLRWSQSGFRGPQLGTAAKPLTRNLFGFHDGVRNPSLTDDATLDKAIWVQPADGPAWLAGGSYLVTRRILLFTDGWDDVPDDEQQRIIGRNKATGAPLSGGTIDSPLDLAATGPDGSPALPLDSHARLASAELNAGAQLLRRSYAFTEPGAGGVQAGQLFCCFQRDPRTGFVPIQRRLSASDALNTHTQHVGSAVFAMPPGVAEGSSWSAALFG